MTWFFRSLLGVSLRCSISSGKSLSTGNRMIYQGSCSVSLLILPLFVRLSLSWLLRNDRFILIVLFPSLYRGTSANYHGRSSGYDQKDLTYLCGSWWDPFNLFVCLAVCNELSHHDTREHLFEASSILDIAQMIHLFEMFWLSPFSSVVLHLFFSFFSTRRRYCLPLTLFFLSMMFT